MDYEAHIMSLFNASKADLDAQVAAATANLTAQKTAAETTITQSYNSQKQLLSSEVEKAGQTLLNSRLQPIVVNATQKSPWSLVLVFSFLTYTFLKKKR